MGYSLHLTPSGIGLRYGREGVAPSMAMRVPALQQFATTTDESLVTWEHTARMMHLAPGKYSTALGRGVRQLEMKAEWLASTFLAGVINDPKNAAVKVPFYGDSRVSSSRIETREKEHGLTRITVHNVPFEDGEDGIGETFFEALLDEMLYISNHWNDDIHIRMHRSFRAELHLSNNPRAEVSFLHEIERNKENWIHRTYAPVTSLESTAKLPSEATSPIGRIAVISGQHLTLLAMLLKNQGHSVPSLTLDDAADADASHTNENGALAGAPRTRIQDHTSIPGGDTPEPKRESENSQAQSSSDPGPPTHFMRTNPYGHSDSHPAFAPVA